MPAVFQSVTSTGQFSLRESLRSVFCLILMLRNGLGLINRADNLFGYSSETVNPHDLRQSGRYVPLPHRSHIRHVSLCGHVTAKVRRFLGGMGGGTREEGGEGSEIRRKTENRRVYDKRNARIPLVIARYRSRGPRQKKKRNACRSGWPSYLAPRWKGRWMPIEMDRGGPERYQKPMPMKLIIGEIKQNALS